MPFSLHFETGKVTSQQLYSEIYQGVLEGRLRSNERLPSTRMLSKKLGIARNTVISVYERLQFEGWIVKKAGSGTYVSNALEQTVNQDKRSIKHYQLGVFGTNAAKKPEIIAPKNLDYDFTLGVPDHQRIAKHIWRHSRLSRLNALTPEFAHGGDLQGLACLRESICEYVRHSRGVICDPEDIIITQGCQQAIMTTLLTLLSPGDLVSTEDPGYPVFRNQARLLGAQIGTVPMDNQGVVVESIPSNTKIIYTTPSHQFPLGFSYSVERKLELLR
ncbi:TPA: PLP-dependent aminotransferase family protein [Vibrio diabolicus]